MKISNVKLDINLFVIFRVYLYNVLQLEKGPIKTFSGGRTESFFVKV